MKSKLEIRELVDQHLDAALALLAARAEFFARHGAVVAAWRRRGRRRSGPYYRLAFRQGGRQQSVYLGREGPAVEQVRCALAALQRPAEQCRALERLRRRVSASLRLSRTRLDGQLRGLGLRLKGSEIRGYRSSALR